MAQGNRAADRTATWNKGFYVRNVNLRLRWAPGLWRAAVTLGLMCTMGRQGKACVRPFG